MMCNTQRSEALQNPSAVSPGKGHPHSPWVGPEGLTPAVIVGSSSPVGESVETHAPAAAGAGHTIVLYVCTVPFGLALRSGCGGARMPLGGQLDSSDITLPCGLESLPGKDPR